MRVNQQPSKREKVEVGKRTEKAGQGIFSCASAIKEFFASSANRMNHYS